MVTRFHDRSHAAETLVGYLSRFSGARNCAVIALPRGGVVLGAVLARSLGLPLDVLIVRKLGVPWQPELAMGAIAEGDFEVLDRELIRRLGITPNQVAEVRLGEQEELERRQHLYRGEHTLTDLPATVILVDDGIATGATMEVAIRAARARGAERIVVAAPVAGPDTVCNLRDLADEVICLIEPQPFIAIGNWYDEFNPVPDSEVKRSLADYAFAPSRRHPVTP